MADRFSDAEILEGAASGGFGRESFGHARSKEERSDVILDDPLNEHDGQEENDGRNVDAAGVGQEVADRSQKWLRQGDKTIPNRADDVVADVDDAEGDEPGQDCARDDDDLIEVQHREDEFD